MKRLVSNTKFQSPEGLIYIGPVSDHPTFSYKQYDHEIDSYSDEFKEAVIKIVNNMKKERNRKGLDLRNYTNDADVLIKSFLNPHSPYSFPSEVLEYADIFDGEYYIDYTDLYRIIETHGVSNHIKNDTKLIKSSPYYISEDKDGQLNLISNQVVLDIVNSDPYATLDYTNHNIEYVSYINRESFTFYPVDKSSAEKMLKVINTLAWNQDITDYIASQAGVLWSD